MSNLSDFLQKPYLGLSLASDTLTLSKTNGILLVANTDATASGATYPRLTLRNAGQTAGYGPEIRLQTKNSGSTNFDAVTIKGSLTTLTAGAEVGKLELSAYNATGYAGLVIEAGAVKPSADAGLTLGTSAARFGVGYFGAAGATYPLTLTPADVTTLAFGGAGFEFHSNGKTYNLAVSAYGASVFNGQNPSDSLLAVGYSGASAFYSQAPGTTGYGIKLDYGIPSSQTAAAIGLSIDMTQAAAAFTTTNVYGIKLGGWSSGAGASVDNAYGLYVDSLGINATLTYGIKIAGSYNYALHCLGAGPILLSSASITDDTNAPYAPAILNVETVSAILDSVPALHVAATTTGYYPTTALARFEGPEVGAYLLLRAAETGTGTTAFSVSANGVTVVGNSGQLSIAKFSVAGRIGSTGNDVYDLASNTTAADAIIVGTHAVASGKFAQMLRLEGSMALSASTAEGYGVASIQTASANVSGSTLHGGYFGASSAGAGAAYGLSVAATGTTGHTGTLRGVSVSVSAQAGTTSTAGLAVFHGGTMSYGLYVNALSAGDDLTYGVYVDNASEVKTAAFANYQRAGATGDFLRYVESGGTTRFAVSYLGDVTIGGTTRKIRADLDNATDSSRLAFQTTGSATKTILSVVPSAGGSESGWAAYDGSDMDNAGRLRLSITTTAAVLESDNTGTGTTRAVRVNIDNVTALQVHTNTDVVLGPGAMATGSTAGFPYIPTCAGAPTGAATSRSGFSPAIVDETNNRIYFRVGSTWRYAALT